MSGIGPETEGSLQGAPKTADIPTAGLEPATPQLAAGCSIQLSYAGHADDQKTMARGGAGTPLASLVWRTPLHCFHDSLRLLLGCFKCLDLFSLKRIAATS